MIVGFAPWSLALAQDTPVTLHIGDPAPSLVGGVFLRGEPIKEFKKGTVYFLDFWATWCGPCRRALPYVEAIPKEPKYAGKVVVIGMDIRETLPGESYDLNKVKHYVENHPDMSYPIVADDEKQDIAKSFYQASGCQGIPTFMVVDKEGKIAWMDSGAIDEKLNSFQPVLDSVIAGTFDSKAYRATLERDHAEVRAFKEGNKLYEEHKYKEGLAIFDQMAPRTKSMIEGREFARLRGLVHIDVDNGLGYARKLTAKADGDPEQLARIAAACSDAGSPAKAFDYAIDLLNQSTAKKPNVYLYYILSSAYKNHGDPQKALEVMQKAEETLNTVPMPENDKSMWAGSIADQLKQLQTEAQKTVSIYPDPSVATTELAAAIQQAKTEHKRIILDFGGNWCGDCRALDQYFKQEPNASLLRENFILVDVNINHADRNTDLAEKYRVPLNKGVPALAVLDENGELLFSQQKGEFEAMRRLAASDLTMFLEHWKKP